ncbi:MAG TPA: hypothetical protein VFS05_05420 [Gemmatimonadaceae bacterium]|nr:hypothetical protein [Gemmatimonadaceae bacterium]
MISPNQRSALAALDAARPTLARLDSSRHAEDTAADLIEVWSAIEAALRSLVGGSVLSGQPLIRELRQRELLTLEQAHALLELLAVHERVQRTEYHPTDADIAVAREAFHALEQALRGSPAPTPAAVGAMGSAPAAAASGAGAGAAPPLAPPPLPSYLPPADTATRGGPGLAILVALIVVLLAAGGIYWYMHRSGVPSEIATGIADYGAGRREAARGDFEKAARDYPKLALPHIYLGRIAREEGDFSTAGNELKTALQLEPGNETAHRELGALFLARGSQFASQRRPDLAAADYDAARRSYVRALGIDPTDRSAQGFLGCTLVRLGRAQEAANWFARAGDGPWSACAAPAAPAPGARTAPAPGGP